MKPIVRLPTEYRAYRIDATYSNRMVVVFDPLAEDVSFIHCVEIWDEGGSQPPNVHPNADEIFFILKGEALARCDGQELALRAGCSFLAPRGKTHQIANAGPGRLYALCTMIPNDGFAELINQGIPVELDAEDLAVLRREVR